MHFLSRLFSPRDMTQGAPWRRIAEFAVPMLIGNLAQQLYNTADSIIVGKFIGDNALAAVGSASPVLNLLLALFVGVAMGAGILVAQSFGAQDREALSRTIGSCILLTLIASALIMLLGPLLTMPLLRLLDTPATIIQWCADYLNIFFWGIAGFFFYNIFSGILRGLGDSLSALGFLLLATALNVGLDLWFVRSMGVAGVALATILSQAISAVFCLLKLLSMRRVFDINRQTLRFNKTYVLRILRLGLPSGATQAVFATALLLVQSLTNSFGELVIAVNVVVMRVDGFAMLPIFSFGEALTTFTGQNVGARMPDRVRAGARQGTLIALGFSALLVAAILVCGRGLFGLFTKTDALIGLGVRALRILAFGYLMMALIQCLSGVMRGVGDTITPMWIAMTTTVGLRVPLAYLFAYLTRSASFPVGKPETLYISLLAAWITGALITAAAYRWGPWRKKMARFISDDIAA